MLFPSTIVGREPVEFTFRDDNRYSTSLYTGFACFLLTERLQPSGIVWTWYIAVSGTVGMSNRKRFQNTYKCAEKSLSWPRSDSNRKSIIQDSFRFWEMGNAKWQLWKIMLQHPEGWCRFWSGYSNYTLVSGRYYDRIFKDFCHFRIVGLQEAQWSFWKIVDMTIPWSFDIGNIG